MPVVYVLLPGSPLRWPVPLQVLGMTSVAVVLVLVSLVTYRFVERPFQRASTRSTTPGLQCRLG